MLGSSAIPDAEDEVDCHYICYVKATNDTLYELDGDLKGPVEKDIPFADSNDILSSGGLDLIQEYVRREDERNIQFSLLALIATRIDD